MPDVVATGFGTTISFAGGFFAEIVDYTPGEITRGEIDTTHTATPGGKKTFMPSDLIDYGSWDVVIHYLPDQEPPIDSDTEEVVVTFQSGTTLTFDGFLTNYGAETPIDDRMTVTCTIKVSGGITIG